MECEKCKEKISLLQDQARRSYMESDRYIKENRKLKEENENLHEEVLNLIRCTDEDLRNENESLKETVISQGRTIDKMKKELESKIPNCS